MADNNMSKAAEVARMINFVRTSSGLNELYIVPHLMEVATERTDDLSIYASHERPNGEWYNDLIDEDIVNYRYSGEIYRIGTESAYDALTDIMSTSEKQMIKNVFYTHIGVGYAEISGTWYADIIFAGGETQNTVFIGQYPAGNIARPSINVSYKTTDGAAILGATIRVTATGESDVGSIESSASLTVSGDSLYFSADEPVQLRNLPYGTYYAVVHVVPEGFENHETVYFSVDCAGNVTPSQINFTSVLSVPEPPEPSVLRISKRNENGENLAGAKMRLDFLGDEGDFSDVTASQNFTLSDDKKRLYFVSQNSDMVLENVPDGDYFLYETSAPEGYRKAERAAFVLDENEVSLTDGNRDGVVSGNVVILRDFPRIDVKLSPLSHENPIIVFPHSTPQDRFQGNGLAVLNPSECISTKNIDMWDVTLTQPITSDGKWRYLIWENVLKIRGQLFRIDMMEVDNYNVKVHASHISHDMAHELIENAEFEGGTGQDFIDFAVRHSQLNGVPDYFYPPYQFAVTTDITDVRSGDKYVNVPFLSAFCGADNCFLNRYGGEMYRDNFRISINRRMEKARDDAFNLRYDMGCSGIRLRIDVSELCTLLACFNNFGTGISVSYGGTDNWAFHHRRRRLAYFNYHDSENEYNQLENDMYALWNSINVPKVSYEIDFVALKSDPRYSDFSVLQNCGYGDRGQIYCPEISIDTEQQIVEEVRDEIRNEAVSMQLGNLTNSIVRPNFMSNTITTGHDIFDKRRKDAEFF